MAFITRSLGYATAASLLILTLLSPRSQRARLYLNTVSYVASLGASSVFGVIASIILSLLPGQRLKINYVVARCFYLTAGTLTGIRFEVEGEEHLNKSRPAVLVGNHQTGIDILYLGRIFPKFASIMAKQELKYAPLLGQFMLLSGAVFINRKNKHDAIKAFGQVGDDMKRRKVSLWVFPEGTRSNLPFPDLLPFKKGAFHLAVQAGVPIVPVVCENYNRLFDGATRFEGGTVRIKVLPPVETKGLTSDDVTDLTTRVREQMLAELQAMDRQRDAEDTSLAAPSGSGSVKRSDAGLSGVAGLVGRLIGTGSGSGSARAVQEKARKEAQRYREKGKTGNPEEYGLVSEGQVSASQAAATATASAVDRHEGSERRTGTSGSGTSAEDADGDAVLVKRPKV